MHESTANGATKLESDPGSHLDLGFARCPGRGRGMMTHKAGIWVHRWRRQVAHGRVIVVRYADDVVMGFQYTRDSRRMLADLQERVTKFRLQLHGEKTRLIEFGRLPALDRRRRGARRPDTFAFFGFTHYCGWTRDGRFVVKCKTLSQRLTCKLTSVSQEVRVKNRLKSVLRSRGVGYGSGQSVYAKRERVKCVRRNETRAGHHRLCR